MESHETLQERDSARSYLERTSIFPNQAWIRNVEDSFPENLDLTSSSMNPLNVL